MAPTSGTDGPSWLAFLAQAKDSLWSVDFFRCESILLRSHWVLVVIDVFTRRLIGFGVEDGSTLKGEASFASMEDWVEIQPQLNQPQWSYAANTPLGE